MHRRVALAAVVLAAALLAGCSSGDDEPAAADSTEPATSDAHSGGVASEGGDTDAGGRDAVVSPGSGRPESVREDYPVPFPAGWEIDIQGEIGMTNTSGAQLLYPNDRYDDVVAFYDDWFESQPEEFARSVIGDEIVYQLLAESVYFVYVTPGHEERDQTWVSLTVSGGG